MIVFRIEAKGSTGSANISFNEMYNKTKRFNITYNPYSNNLIEELEEKVKEKLIEYGEKEEWQFLDIIKNDYKLIELWDEKNRGILALININ